jgi:hypothetical protein
VEAVNCLASMKALLSMPFADLVAWPERLQRLVPIFLHLVLHLVVHTKKLHIALLLNLSQHVILLRHRRLSPSLDPIHPCHRLASLLPDLVPRRLTLFKLGALIHLRTHPWPTLLILCQLSPQHAHKAVRIHQFLSRSRSLPHPKRLEKLVTPAVK